MIDETFRSIGWTDSEIQRMEALIKETDVLQAIHIIGKERHVRQENEKKAREKWFTYAMSVTSGLALGLLILLVMVIVL